MQGPQPGLRQKAQAAKPGLQPGPEPRHLRAQETLRQGLVTGPKPRLNLRVQKLLRPGPLLGPQSGRAQRERKRQGLMPGLQGREPNETLQNQRRAYQKLGRSQGKKCW